MDIKAVFFDIDGTFYDHDNNKVLDESIEAVKKLKANGYKVALCSGRPKEMADELAVFEMVEWDGYIGCAGGIAMNEKYEIIYEDCYSETQMEQMYSIADTHNISLYSFGKHEFVNQPKCEIVEKMIEEYHLKEPKIKKWEKEKLNAVSAIKNKHFKKELFEKIEGISYTASTPYGIDFVKDGVNKAKGIQQLMKYWQIEEGSYVAFGDSLNDLEMLTHAKVGVAMGNGHPSIKAIATIVCGDDSEASIANTLKELKLI